MKLDSSSLIYLSKVECIELLHPFYKPIRIPDSVYNEVVITGLEKQLSDAYMIKRLIETNIVKVVADETIESSLIEGLGKGEQRAISEAFTNNELLIIDDKKARNRAKALEIRVLGSDTLLLDALYSNHINHDIFRKKLSRLSHIMLLRPDKVEKLKELAEEISR